MRYYKFPKWLKRFYPNAIWDFFLQENSSVIYLTFDDGPTPEVTKWVLDCLDKYQAKATFFCLGKNVKNNPQLFNEILKHGHAVGNHSMNHLKGINTSTKKYIDDVVEAKKYIKSNLFRPPYGKCLPAQHKELSKLGFQTVFWSHISYDYDKTLSSTQRLKHLKLKVKPGTIIVFHDSQKAFPQLQNELPIILQYYKTKGYQFKVIPNNE